MSQTRTPHHPPGQNPRLKTRPQPSRTLHPGHMSPCRPMGAVVSDQTTYGSLCYLELFLTQTPWCGCGRQVYLVNPPYVHTDRLTTRLPQSDQWSGSCGPVSPCPNTWFPHSTYLWTIATLSCTWLDPANW